MFFLDKHAVEIERKFIVSLPSLEFISTLPDYSKSEITQIYLCGSAGVTHRIRKRVYSDRCEYTETKKIRIDESSAFEDEREIDSESFYMLSQKIKEGTSPICKERYTFSVGAQLFELDVYPQWKRSAILEAELENRDTELSLPQFIKLIKEVTGNRAYSNAGMARSFPPEE